VPITITSLRAPNDVIPQIHAYGGIVLHDVISVRHAEKALEAGVDGLILVCAGAGGHAGTLSPFALIGEVRRFFDGPIVLSGAISSGNAILAAQAAGADLAYIGTRFPRHAGSERAGRYKEESCGQAARPTSSTRTCSPACTAITSSTASISAGFDPLNLPKSDPKKMNFGSGRAWKRRSGAISGARGKVSGRLTLSCRLRM
jgi:nitronate monooxygenase